MHHPRSRPAHPALLPSLAVLGVAAILCLHGCSTPETDQRPNVILVLIDTFRPDHLAHFGYPKTTAPFLDEVLAHSVVFSNAFSTSSWTAPSVASAFTSLYPVEHGVTDGFLAHQSRLEAQQELGVPSILLNRLPDSVKTLPELLKDAGYSTFGLAANINIGSAIGFDRGFDRFDQRINASAQNLARRVLEWKEEIRRSRPFFLYLHFNDVHAPYHQRSPWFEEGGSQLETTISAYDSEISFLDSWLRQILDSRNWGADTLLILISDHGEEFEEHGEIGHGFSLHGELTRVLLAITRLGEQSPSASVDLNVSLVDVAPTVLELTGCELPAWARGKSLARFVLDDADSSLEEELRDRPLFSQRGRYRDPLESSRQQIQATVWRSWKLLVTEAWDEESVAPRVEVFDLQSDRGEIENVLSRQPSTEQLLFEYLVDFQKLEPLQETEHVEVSLDDETLTALKELGYVEE